MEGEKMFGKVKSKSKKQQKKSKGYNIIEYKDHKTRANSNEG